MAILNDICSVCEHLLVCKINDKLAVFSDDAKKDLGVDIKIEKCISYQPTEEE